MIELVEELKEKYDCKILVVDDGSGEKYSWIFERVELLGAVVVKFSFSFFIQRKYVFVYSHKNEFKIYSKNN